MTLTKTKTIYINGTSKYGDRILGNFNASLSENGQMSINETVGESTNLDTVEADFDEFRKLAKNELKKFNGQDAETDVSIDKSGDSKVSETDNKGTEEKVKNDTTEEAVTTPEDKTTEENTDSTLVGTDTSDTKDGEAVDESN